MAFLDSSNSAVVEAILTETGKETLITNPNNFKITKFALFDDEIDYTETEASITATLIPEPITRDNSLLYTLITLPKGSITIAALEFNHEDITLYGNGSTTLYVRTLNGGDLGYEAVIATNNLTIEAADIIQTAVNTPNVVQSINISDDTLAYQSIQFKNTLKITAENIVGTYYIIIKGLNSGAEKTLKITVSTTT